MLLKHKTLQLAYTHVCPLHDLRAVVAAAAAAAATADMECARLLSRWSCCHADAFPLVVVLLRSQHWISTRPLPPPLYSPQQIASDHDISRDFPNKDFVQFGDFSSSRETRMQTGFPSLRDIHIPAASTTNFLKWSAYGK